MSQMLFIRSHTWGEAERRLFQQMQGYFGSDIALTFDATRAAPPADLPVRTVAITPDRLARLGLATPQDWGWRCGDFFYYAGVQDFPGFDYYWLIEPDVMFNKLDIAEFFGRFEARPEDFLACYIGVRDGKWGHHAAALKYFDKVYGCVFPLTRLSARAIDLLQATRSAHIVQPDDQHGYINDEAFVASTLCQAEGYSHASLNTIAPNLLTQKTFNTAMIYLDAECPGLPPGIFHPVMSPEDLSRKVAKKIGMRSSFDHYSPRFRKYLTASDNDKFYATMLRRLSRDHAAPYRIGRDLPPILVENANFPHSMIVKKSPKSQGERAGPGDFRISPPTYTESIDLTRMAPYHWSLASDQIILVDSPPPLTSSDAPFNASQRKGAQVVATTPAAKLRAFLPETEGQDPLFILMRGSYCEQGIFEALKSLDIPAYLSCHAIDGQSIPPDVAMTDGAISGLQTIARVLALHGGRTRVAIGIDTEVVSDPRLYLRAFPRAIMLLVEHPMAVWAQWSVAKRKLAADEIFGRLGSTLHFLEKCRDHPPVDSAPLEDMTDTLRWLLAETGSAGPAGSSPTLRLDRKPAASRQELPDWLAEYIDRENLGARMTAVGLLEP